MGFLSHRLTMQLFLIYQVDDIHCFTKPASWISTTASHANGVVSHIINCTNMFA